MAKGDASIINDSAGAINGGARVGGHDESQLTKESHSDDPKPPLGSIDNTLSQAQVQHARNAVKTTVVNSNAGTSEQRHAPMGGMATSMTDYSPDEGASARIDTHKQASEVTGKSRGAFSYASALKTLQQQSQRETGPVDDAGPHPCAGTTITE
ncbi:hypothetical protein EC968_007003 [Mortierella alpina]|nr:hypothetical protein EC968_007003 [Mortierella alpina]